MFDFNIVWISLLGLVAGFISATPPGPINLLLANSIFAGRSESHRYFLGGVLLADAAFATLACLGYQNLGLAPEVAQWIIRGGCGLRYCTWNLESLPS